LEKGKVVTGRKNGHASGGAAFSGTKEEQQWRPGLHSQRKIFNTHCRPALQKGREGVGGGEMGVQTNHPGGTTFRFCGKLREKAVVEERANEREKLAKGTKRGPKKKMPVGKVLTRGGKRQRKL